VIFLIARFAFVLIGEAHSATSMRKNVQNVFEREIDSNSVVAHILEIAQKKEKK
jgi:hypothetical protein